MWGRGGAGDLSEACLGPFSAAEGPSGAGTGSIPSSAYFPGETDTTPGRWMGSRSEQCTQAGMCPAKPCSGSWLTSFGQKSPLFFFFSEMSLKTNLFIIFICGKGVHDTYMKIRKPYVRAGSLLPTCGWQCLNSGCQALQ